MDTEAPADEEEIVPVDAMSGEMGPDLGAEVEDLQRRVDVVKSKYKSPHFSNIPNYIAHMRLNDRRDSDEKDDVKAKAAAMFKKLLKS